MTKIAKYLLLINYEFLSNIIQTDIDVDSMFIVTALWQIGLYLCCLLSSVPAGL